MSAKQIIIDASVALKWRLRDEEATSQADALLDDYLAGKLGLLTPTLFDYEITNALKVAVTKGRLTENEAITALIDFQAFNIKLYNFQELQTLTFRLAYQHQRSVYDSAYLALAQLKGLWFYTGDKRLFNAVSQTLSWVKWVGDYQLEVIPAS
ncbi:MAG: type II toxin-antitoxin system VapC family toxin [Anaerolineae bacterium]|nr:type II toxin-antitoxin system VapC family toxin [Anaerolineales bacterium]MCQ3971943.1 PIN domain nuclease [Anaerolineae bacterium]